MASRLKWYDVMVLAKVKLARKTSTGFRFVVDAGFTVSEVYAFIGAGFTMSTSEQMPNGCTLYLFDYTGAT
jgi:hypothetical protein